MRLNSRTWTRAIRVSRHIGRDGQLGHDIIDFLRSKPMQAVMAAAATEGIAPVSAVSGPLIEHFGNDVLDPKVRRFIGLAVRAVLDDLNFEPTSRGAKLPEDKLFSTGSIYRSSNSETQTEVDALLARLIDALTVPELKRAKQHIDNKLEKKRLKS